MLTPKEARVSEKLLKAARSRSRDTTGLQAVAIVTKGGGAAVWRGRQTASAIMVLLRTREVAVARHTTGLHAVAIFAGGGVVVVLIFAATAAVVGSGRQMASAIMVLPRTREVAVARPSCVLPVAANREKMMRMAKITMLLVARIEFAVVRVNV